MAKKQFFAIGNLFKRLDFFAFVYNILWWEKKRWLTLKKNHRKINISAHITILKMVHKCFGVSLWICTFQLMFSEKKWSRKQKTNLLLLTKIHWGDCMFLSCHVCLSEWIHTLQLSECQLLAWRRHKIWSLRDCSWTRTQYHLVCKRTLNHLTKWLTVRLWTKWFWVQVQLHPLRCLWSDKILITIPSKSMKNSSVKFLFIKISDSKT